MCCENFGRFHRRKFKKIKKSYKNSKKHIDLGIYNLRLKPKILTFRRAAIVWLEN